MDLVISHVYKDFGRGPVLRDVSLTVRQGETVCLMGPSGLGKTTLLRCVAGLERPESGSITGVPERLGYVFQEDRLCGVFSAVANVRLATGRALPEPEILRHLEELGLAGSARRPVSQLSGGMRRRVAIARAVCAGPQLLLLDEAFKGLDDQCRRDTVAYIPTTSSGSFEMGSMMMIPGGGMGSVTISGGPGGGMGGPPSGGGNDGGNRGGNGGGPR